MQAAALFLSEHTAFVPQGVGLHGSIISGRAVVAKNLFYLFKTYPFVLYICNSTISQILLWLINIKVLKFKPLAKKCNLYEVST